MASQCLRETSNSRAISSNRDISSQAISNLVIVSSREINNNQAISNNRIISSQAITNSQVTINNRLRASSPMADRINIHRILVMQNQYFSKRVTVQCLQRAADLALPL